ncbi:exosome complex protein Rrp42 [Candidatus Woesearchaeota archaeon]|nr:exosome complex protein Rrp42 [Candidatus Woesearchaeota archaeon]
MVSELKSYIESLLSKGVRADLRKLDEYRKPINVEYGISAKSAEGSAKITMGDTVIVAGVKFGVDKPYPDNPDEGSIVVNVELLPLSSPDFESGPPDVDAIELARVVDRAVRESKAIDFKKLCIKEGEKCWMIFIDIYTINEAGNLFDAANLAALAALQDARYPKYDEKTGVVAYDERTSKPIELLKIPISCTILKIGNNLIVDPDLEEEKAMDARLTVATADDDTICAMQKGGEVPLTTEEVKKIVDIAFKKRPELLKYLKK